MVRIRSASPAAVVTAQRVVSGSTADVCFWDSLGAIGTSGTAFNAGTFANPATLNRIAIGQYNSGTGDFPDLSFTTVPEPSVLALLGVGAAACFVSLRSLSPSGRRNMGSR